MPRTTPKADPTTTPVEVIREAGTRVRKGVAQAGQKGREVIDAAKEKSEAVISGALEKSEAVISNAREKGEELIEETREKTMRAAAETNRLFYEHPIAAVAAAAAAGAVLGIFLPRLNITNRVGKAATRAVKAAVATEAAQMLISGVTESAKTRKVEEPDAEV